MHIPTPSLCWSPFGDEGANPRLGGPSSPMNTRRGHLPLGAVGGPSGCTPYHTRERYEYTAIRVSIHL